MTEEIDFRNRENWVRNPEDYPAYPSPRARSAMRWSSAGIAHLNNWWKFFAGLREKPPERSGLLRPNSPQERQDQSQDSKDSAKE